MRLKVEIKKTFDGFTLESAFALEEGVLGLLGASGSGKSMTLRCIAGIVRPDSGRIVLDGRVLFDSAAKIDLPPQKRRVGLLFQHYALFPKMTAAQNIAAAIKQRDRRAESVERLLALLRLEGLGGRYPHQLSGGQQQRVALARMLASEPEILLFDEPFSALDGQLRHTIEPEFSQLLATAARPAIYVSHSVGEIYRFCTHAAALVDGRVIESAPTKPFFSAPKQCETARLLGVQNLAALAGQRQDWADVPDWGVRLRFPGQTTDSGFVGIHADDLCLCTRSGENCIPIEIEAVCEQPRTSVVTVHVSGAKKSLQLVCDRTKHPALAVGASGYCLQFPPERLLLLRG